MDHLCDFYAMHNIRRRCLTCHDASSPKEHFAYHQIKACTPLSVDCYNVSQSMATSWENGVLKCLVFIIIKTQLLWLLDQMSHDWLLHDRGNNLHEKWSFWQFLWESYHWYCIIYHVSRLIPAVWRLMTLMFSLLSWPSVRSWLMYLTMYAIVVDWQILWWASDLLLFDYTRKLYLWR